MSKAKQCCGTCAHADLPRTTTGRVSRIYAGRCTAPVDLSKLLPHCIAPCNRIMPRRCVWANDGATCPRYVTRDTK